mgnify:CR=1 FL=1
MAELITGILQFIIAFVTFMISIRSFQEKGFLFHNSYIHASKEERENLDKKAYYHQTAIVFILISIIFLLNGITLLVKAYWIIYIVLAIVCAAIIYAIVSSIKMK